ncbi:MAG: quinoprotein glucose dehydrogenase, partial [Verrucomicrobiales bacterium]
MQFSPGIFLRLFLLMVLSTSAWSQEKGALAHGGAKPFEIVFEPVAGRFFRLVSDEAAGNDRYANVADLQLLQAADGQPISRELWSVFESSNGFGVDSESSLYAIDEDLATAWKSHGEPPHHIDIDLHQTIILAGFRYLPNLETDGAIHKFSVFVSDDGVQWGNPVMRGTLVPKADGLADETRMGAPDPIDLVRQEFTSSGMVYGPVAIDVDHRNRVYVAETYRYDGRGVIDNRGKTRREEDDLQTNSLEERRGFLNAWLADGELQTEISAERNDFKSDGSDLFTKYSEKVALLEDRDGDGRADHRKIVAEGFNDMLAGAGAGVLVRGNDIYFACIPSIWRLTDTDGDDVANEREEISRGYGIRTGWFGHDLHGLTWGPDGRLYFSMADRGFDVRTKEGNVYHGTNTGAVFRCWPDGSDLEMVAKGMRNPQELAFDDLGYLFTGDNNCDAGDRARLVYVVDGGDSGWRVSVQSLADRGPWLGEAMWELPREEEGLQPAWIVPPLAHLNSGPSGMAHYPGTGLPESYRDYFFLCDYRGGRGSIQSFRVKPKGASFSLSGHHTFHDGPTVSDVAFGYDGKVYASEWGPGWGISEHASIYTLTTADPKIAEVRDVQTWFGHGFKDFDNEQLGDKLGHGDQRVRYEAQRVLADRKAKAVFVSVLAESSNLQ